MTEVGASALVLVYGVLLLMLVFGKGLLGLVPHGPPVTEQIQAARMFKWARHYSEHQRMNMFLGLLATWVVGGMLLTATLL
jgi:hypothetical protein